ncbi:MAG: serine hydrolase domain-containing protein [Candidatus Heimdallarchaeota archaeon]
MMDWTRKLLILLIMISILETNCFYTLSTRSTTSKSGRTEQEPSYWPTNGWRTSTPEEQGVSSIKLEELYGYFNSTLVLRNTLSSMGSLLIIRNGYLIHENYFSSYLHGERGLNIYSCTKSITSTLIGIALEEGYIGGVEDKILSYFPNRTFQDRDSWKEAMTIEDLLTMRSGLSWDESDYNDPNNDYFQMYSSQNAVQYVLDKPMTSFPGTSWVYNTGNSHLLSAIIDKTTENGTKEFAQTRLFNPLGISPTGWSLDSQNVPFGGSNLKMKPREMAKFGYLFLQNGTWEGQQLVSQDWIAAATKQTDTTSFYGYQWWIEPARYSYSARGYKGQRIVIIPNYDLVIVFTANTFADWDLYPILIDQYIIPAIGYIPQSSTTTESQRTSFLIFPVILALGTLLTRRKRTN